MNCYAKSQVFYASATRHELIELQLRLIQHASLIGLHHRACMHGLLFCQYKSQSLNKLTSVGSRTLSVAGLQAWNDLQDEE